MFPFWFISLSAWAWGGLGVANFSLGALTFDAFIFVQCLLAIAVALIGVWTADRARPPAQAEMREIASRVSGDQVLGHPSFARHRGRRENAIVVTAKRRRRASWA